MKSLLRPYYKNGQYYNWDKKQYHHYWQMLELAISQCMRHPIETINAYKRRSLINKSNGLLSVHDLPSAPIITWLGHSTFLIQVDGIRILTDPVFEDLPFPFPKPLIKSSFAISNLPPIDIVLISHCHADHFDLRSLSNLFVYHKPLFLVPLNCKAYFLPSMQELVYEHNWWDFFAYKQITFTFLPAYHWSGVSWQTINKSLWGSWMVSLQNQNIYFAGDTAYGIHFQYIADQFPSIDIALMPFSACRSQKEYEQMLHLTPEGFLLACKDLGAKEIIPMHWGMFSLYQDRFKSINLLQEHWSDIMPNCRLRVLSENESYIKKG